MVQHGAAEARFAKCETTWWIAAGGWKVVGFPSYLSKIRASLGEVNDTNG